MEAPRNPEQARSGKFQPTGPAREKPDALNASGGHPEGAELGAKIGRTRRQYGVNLTRVLSIEDELAPTRQARSAGAHPTAAEGSSCSTILLSSGADLQTLAKIRGHTTIKTTARCAHQQMSAQGDALAEAFGRPAGGNYTEPDTGKRHHQ